MNNAKQEISLAKALKEKNRLVTELKNIQKIIVRENSKLDNSTSTIDLNEVWNEYNKIENALIVIKSEICKANIGIIDKIMEMAELKGKIVFLESIPTIDGEQKSQSHFGGETITKKYIAHLKQEHIDWQISDLRKSINKLQDKIDEYNVVTKISI